jgi:hypothetical protein
MLVVGMNYIGRPDALRKVIRKAAREGRRLYGGEQKNAAMAEHYRTMWRDAAIDMAGISSPDRSEYVGWVIPAEEAAAIFDEVWETGGTLCSLR